MVVVFGSFILNDQRTVTMFGFGLAMAIAVYALVVMLVLVPGLLAIAGHAAWWQPSPGRARSRRAGLGRAVAGVVVCWSASSGGARNRGAGERSAGAGGRPPRRFPAGRSRSGHGPA